MVTSAKDPHGSAFTGICSVAPVGALLLWLVACAPAPSGARTAQGRADAPIAETTFGIRLAPLAPAAAGAPAAVESTPTDRVPVDLAQVVHVCVLSDPVIQV